jgi:hypothetical protein
MDVGDIQFIIESPQTTASHKKRPRLVTSCDSWYVSCRNPTRRRLMSGSRLKKIKCLQPSPETKCEACKVAKVPCRFKDRERYFAERSRAIAGPSANVHAPSYSSDQRCASPSFPQSPRLTFRPSRHDQNPALDAFSVASSSSSPALSNSAPRSNSHSPKASGLVSPEGDPSGRYPYPPDTRRGDPNYRYGTLLPWLCLPAYPSPSRHSSNSSLSSFHSRNNSYGYSNYMGSPAPALPHSNSRPPPTQPQPDYRHVQLFEPDREVPNHTLMQHFIQVFIEHLGHEFPFLTYDQLMSDNWEGRMPAPLANVIAAMASRSALSLFPTASPSPYSHCSGSLLSPSLPFEASIPLQKPTRTQQRCVCSCIRAPPVAKLLFRTLGTHPVIFAPWICCMRPCCWLGPS